MSIQRFERNASTKGTVCPENTRKSETGAFPHTRRLRNPIGQSHFLQSHKCNVGFASRGEEEGMRKYEGIGAVYVLGYSLTRLLWSLGAGNPHTVSVTPDRHQ